MQEMNKHLPISPVLQNIVRKDDCMVCSPTDSMHPACRDPSSGSFSGKIIERNSSSTLQDFIEFLQTDLQFQLKRPSITNKQGVVYMQNPEVLRKAHAWKLEKPLAELAESGVFEKDVVWGAGGEQLTITDASAPTFVVKLRLKKE